MPEVEKKGELVKYTPTEVAELLIRAAGIKEGLWCPYLEFTLQGASIDASDNKTHPAAIMIVTKIGIQQVSDTKENWTVDAAALNAERSAMLN